ncbi:hypothetical protein [Paenibacillus sp. SN-8-1]|uniref:hypothetical protein n=1 Tax=Paenibacillus sp. SN-8-1 TaxID=3435409 RepID=UPI003D9A2864
MADKHVKIEVLDAIVDGQGKGAVFAVEAESAQYLAKIGYVRIVDEKGAEDSEPKAPAKATTKRTTK